MSSCSTLIASSLPTGKAHAQSSMQVQWIICISNVSTRTPNYAMLTSWKTPVFTESPGHTLVQQGQDLTLAQQQELANQFGDMFSVEQGRTCLIQHDIKTLSGNNPTESQRPTTKPSKVRWPGCCRTASLRSLPDPGPAPLLQSPSPTESQDMQWLPEAQPGLRVWLLLSPLGRQPGGRSWECPFHLHLGAHQRLLAAGPDPLLPGPRQHSAPHQASGSSSLAPMGL